MSPTRKLMAALSRELERPNHGSNGNAAKANRKKPKTGPGLRTSAAFKASIPDFVPMNVDPQHAEFKIITAFQKSVTLLHRTPVDPVAVALDFPGDSSCSRTIVTGSLTFGTSGERSNARAAHAARAARVAPVPLVPSWLLVPDERRKIKTKRQRIGSPTTGPKRPKSVRAARPITRPIRETKMFENVEFERGIWFLCIVLQCAAQLEQIWFQIWGPVETLTLEPRGGVTIILSIKYHQISISILFGWNMIGMLMEFDPICASCYPLSSKQLVAHKNYSANLSIERYPKYLYVILRASAGLFVSAVSQCHSLCLCLSSKDIP